jgi:hypothetical protein
VFRLRHLQHEGICYDASLARRTCNHCIANGILTEREATELGISHEQKSDQSHLKTSNLNDKLTNLSSFPAPYPLIQQHYQPQLGPSTPSAPIMPSPLQINTSSPYYNVSNITSLSRDRPTNGRATEYPAPFIHTNGHQSTQPPHINPSMGAVDHHQHHHSHVTASTIGVVNMHAPIAPIMYINTPHQSIPVLPIIVITNPSPTHPPTISTSRTSNHHLSTSAVSIPHQMSSSTSQPSLSPLGIPEAPPRRASHPSSSTILSSSNMTYKETGSIPHPFHQNHHHYHHQLQQKLEISYQEHQHNRSFSDSYQQSTHEHHHRIHQQQLLQSPSSNDSPTTSTISTNSSSSMKFLLRDEDKSHSNHYSLF